MAHIFLHTCNDIHVYQTNHPATDQLPVVCRMSCQSKYKSKYIDENVDF
jgi:hypothetical protein